MHEVAVINVLHGVENALEERLDLLFAKRGLAVLQPLAEMASAHELHDDVGGVVGLEELERAHDAAVTEAAQHIGLLLELLQGTLEVLAVGVGQLAEQNDRVALPGAHHPDEELLDGVAPPRLTLLDRGIGDAEAAAAEHLLDDVFADAGAGLQRVRVICRCRPFCHASPPNRPYSLGGRTRTVWPDVKSKPQKLHCPCTL